MQTSTSSLAHLARKSATSLRLRTTPAIEARTGQDRPGQAKTGQEHSPNAKPISSLSHRPQVAQFRSKVSHIGLGRTASPADSRRGILALSDSSVDILCCAVLCCSNRSTWRQAPSYAVARARLKWLTSGAKIRLVYLQHSALILPFASTKIKAWCQFSFTCLIIDSCLRCSYNEISVPATRPRSLNN